MANVRPIGVHSDKKWIKAFHRYYIIRKIVKTESWKQFLELLENTDDEKQSHQLFKEFKLLNFVTGIEHQLCTLLDYMYNKNQLKSEEDIRNFIIDSIKKYRNISVDKAKDLLKEETDNDIKRMINPHILFYVAGMDLGNLRYIIQNKTLKYNKKSPLIKKIQQLQYDRNYIVHNKLSSRIDLENLLNSSLKNAKFLYKELEQKINVYMLRSFLPDIL